MLQGIAGLWIKNLSKVSLNIYISSEPTWWNLHVHHTNKTQKMNNLLSLFLRTNDTLRLDSSIWDYLTLRDLYQLRSVCKFTYEELKLVEYNRCRDGKGIQKCIYIIVLGSVILDFIESHLHILLHRLSCSIPCLSWSSINQCWHEGGIRSVSVWHHSANMYIMSFIVLTI